jgi:hypothetical protein
MGADDGCDDSCGHPAHNCRVPSEPVIRNSAVSSNHNGAVMICNDTSTDITNDVSSDAPIAPPGYINPAPPPSTPNYL